MTLVTLVQARMGSTRLPGKVLMRVGGKTVLEHVIGRVRMCPADTGELVVATSAHGGDNVIEDLCRELGVACFRSSERDVLHRFQMAAVHYGADRVLRVTADCPLLCPQLTGDVLLWPGDAGFDYVAFQDVPLGLSPELISGEALYRCWRESTDPLDREHVTLYALNRPDVFRVAFLQPEDWLFDRRHWRLTLDEREDFDLLERLFVLTAGELFGLSSGEVVAAVERDGAAFELATRRP